MDGILALDLWDVVTEVLHSSYTAQKNSARKGRVKELRETAAGTANVKLRKESNQNVDQLASLDHVATDVNSSECEAQPYIFEDNESCDQDGHQRTKYDDETRAPNPQGRVRLVS